MFKLSYEIIWQSRQSERIVCTLNMCKGWLNYINIYWP